MSPRPAAAIALLLPITAAHAQHTAMGIKGGVVLSTARSELVSYGLVPGATFGSYLAAGVAKRIEVQPELMLSLQGASYAMGENGKRWVDYQLYAHLPVSVKFFLSNTFNLHLGGQAGWLMLARTYTDDGGRNTTDRFLPLDAGIIAGLGLDLMYGTDITLRYYGGVTPTLADDGELFPRNRTLELTVGHRFKPFKRRFAHRRG